MRITKYCAIVVAFAFSIMVMGCRHNTQVSKDKGTQAPTIKAPSPTASLKVTPETVDKGQPAELTWNTQNATTVNIDGIGTVSASGSKKITPVSSTTYHLSAQGDGGATEASARVTVNIPDDRTSKLTPRELLEKSVKDVFFNYDNADIRADEAQIVGADADLLAKYPDVKIVIEGHCDERGSEEYNMGLGENRASTVRQTLINKGVSPDRIQIISYGKERPFCRTGEDESCLQQNRRAHFAFSE